MKAADLTDEQRRAGAAIEAAIASGTTFALHGLAGTGKTTVVAHIARSHPGALLCAYTGKAASILRDKTGLDATTVHAAFYQFVREEEDEDGRPPKLVFRPAHLRGSLKGQVVLLYECSMIDCAMAADILQTGITVVATGDPGQLPPINGDPFFTRASFTLREIHRQALDSPIIRQAHAVRQTGRYAADGEAFQVVERATTHVLQSAEAVLVHRRATRSKANAVIRMARGYDSPWPRMYEPLICLRTARRYGLYNNAVYYASRDMHPSDQTIGISTDAGNIEVPAVFLPPGHEYDPLDLPPGGWKTAFAFGYALTVHKAQGSEFASVLLYDECHMPDMRTQWLYTGITRAAERIVVAKSLDLD